MTQIDFHAVNARDVVLKTFGDVDLARKWVKANADTHPGLHVREVVTTVVSRRVYVPRISLATINGRSAA